MTDVKGQNIDELFERGFFHDIYVEALRLKKENAAIEEKLRVAVEALTAIGNMTIEPVTRQFADDRLDKLKGGK